MKKYNPTCNLLNVRMGCWGLKAPSTMGASEARTIEHSTARGGCAPRERSAAEPHGKDSRTAPPSADNHPRGLRPRTSFLTVKDCPGRSPDILGYVWSAGVAGGVPPRHSSDARERSELILSASCLSSVSDCRVRKRTSGSGERASRVRDATRDAQTNYVLCRAKRDSLAEHLNFTK